MEDISGKRVLVVGLARSGVSTVKALHRLGAKVVVHDMKDQEALADMIEAIDGLVFELVLGEHPKDISSYDLIVVSPGVPLTLPFIQEAFDTGVELIGELELAYRIAKGNFIGITGTNGKTTTTALVGEIFKNAGRKSFVVGNIGIPVIEKAFESDEHTDMITEVSSFQLETTSTFNPSVSTILNVTPDHLNRHKTMENYIEAKCKIFENNGDEDLVILNYDNEITRKIGEKTDKNIMYFSRLSNLEKGIVVENGRIVIKDEGRKIDICSIKDIFVPGPHNLENALAASGLAYFSNIEPRVIAETLKTFKGVEHRIEYVGEKKGVIFYNDSKGTNPDASIKAVEAMDRPTVLIAGGMDKGSEFKSFVETFGDTVKHLVLLGETAEKIAMTAREMGFDQISKCGTMDEAVTIAYDIAVDGDCILLSPACASWDMYESFEHRGQHFKTCFSELRG